MGIEFRKKYVLFAIILTFIICVGFFCFDNFNNDKIYSKDYDNTKKEGISLYDLSPNYFWLVNGTINKSISGEIYYGHPSVFYKDNAWYIIIGDYYGSFWGYTWNGTNWVTNNTITDGLPDYPTSSAVSPSVFYKDNAWYLLTSTSDYNIDGFQFNGTQWLVNGTINASLSSTIIEDSLFHPSVFYKDNAWYMISGSYDSGYFHGFQFNGTNWVTNNTIKDGLPELIYNTPSVFYKDNAWYMISGDASGYFHGFQFNGTKWLVNGTINASLSATATGNSASSPSVFYKDNAWYMISGSYIAGMPGFIFYRNESADTSYPQFSSYYDNNASLINSGLGLFNVTVENTNGTVWLEINNTNITATNLTSNVYNVSYNFSSAGTYAYRWYAYGNGTLNNLNYSALRSYTVNITLDPTPPYFTLIPANTSINYTQGFGVYFNATDETAFGYYNVNDSRFKINSSGYLTNSTQNLAVGNYYINVSINDTSGNSNSTIYFVNISKATSTTCGIFVNPAMTVIYPTETAYNMINLDAGDGDVVYHLFRDDVEVSIPDVVTLGVGAYDYLLNSTGGQNWTDNPSCGGVTLTVNQNTSAVIYTYLNNSRENITIYNNTAIWLNATLFNVTGTIYLYKNGTLINSGNSPLSNLTDFNGTGIYNITAIYPSNTNYSGSSETWWVNVTPVYDTTTPNINITSPTNGTNSTDISLNINYTVSDTNLQSCWYSNDSYSANTTLASCVNLTTIVWSEGYHNVTIWANDTSNNVNSSSVSFRIDTLPPYFTNLANKNLYIGESLNYNIDATDDGVGLSYFAINWTTNFSINSTGFLKNTSSLSAGTYHINVSVNDTLGNLNSSIISVTVAGSILVVTSGTTSICENLTYDYVYVSSGATLEIDSACGYANLTALINITIYGTINGNEKGLGTAGTGGSHGDPYNGLPGNQGISYNGSIGGGGGGGGGSTATCYGSGAVGSAGVSSNPIGSQTGRYEIGINWTGSPAGGGGGGGKGKNAGCAEGSVGSDGSSSSKGGGSIKLTAPLILINGTIQMGGGNGGAGGTGGAGGAYGGNGGGGGAGASAGEIIIDGQIVNITGSNLYSTGGTGGSGGAGGTGGSGGLSGQNGQQGAGGRIKIFYGTLYNNSVTTSVTGGIVGTVYYEQISYYKSFNISLNLPLNNSNLSTSNPEVNFTLIGDAPSYSCSVYFNNLSKGSNSSVLNNTLTTITTSSLSDGLYDWFVNCTAGLSVNSSETRKLRIDTTPPQINILSPLIQNYITNSSFNLNYSVSDSGVNQMSCWYNIINESGSTIISNTSLASCGNTTFSLPSGDINYNITLFSNDSLGNENYSTVIFGIRTETPAVILNAPSNNKYVKSGLNTYFNFTASRTIGIDTCQLWTNITGNWLLNYTWIKPKNMTMNYTILNLLDTSIIWNVKCNDTAGNIGWALNNNTFTVDSVNPIMNNLTLTTTAGSQTIDFTASVTDTNLGNCYYTIYNSSGSVEGLNNNISFSCNVLSHATTTSYGEFTLNITAYDLAGNNNNISSPFTTESSGVIFIPGGAGGGTTLYQAKNFSVLSTNFINSLDIGLARNSVLPRRINFIIKNDGIKEIDLELKCSTDDVNKSSNDVNICDYVTFEKETLSAPGNANQPVVTGFSILTPENASFGDNYYFNILAISTGTSEYASMSVSSHVDYFSLIYKNSYIPGTDKAYPVWLVALSLSLIAFFLVLLPLVKAKIPITGFFGGIAIFVVIFGLTLYFL